MGFVLGKRELPHPTVVLALFLIAGMSGSCLYKVV